MHNETDLDMTSSNNPSIIRRQSADRTVYYVAKRAVDILLASGLLVLFSPLMLVIIVAIRLYSPGPIFFAQERVGANRKSHGKDSNWQQTTFRCFKFRTMHFGADSSVHQAYVKALIENDHEAMANIQGNTTNLRKLVHDGRITRPGKLLRKLSLDELPQLWNVLRGDMSLVGPRPAIPYEVRMYKPWHMQRLKAQPGLTGLQQVMARSTVDFDQQVLLDVAYIDQQSLWLDIKIILMTPFVILSTRGAE